jgi:hypothetical protein
MDTHEPETETETETETKADVKGQREVESHKPEGTKNIYQYRTLVVGIVVRNANRDITERNIV